MFSRTLVTLVLAWSFLLSPMHQSRAAVYEKTYYFICKHSSEGFSGLTGPSRLTYALAQPDEVSHLKAHVDHKGYTSIITNQ